MGTTSNAYGYLTHLCGTTATGYLATAATTGNWYEDDRLAPQQAQQAFAQAYQNIWQPPAPVKKVVSFIQSLRDEVDNWLKLEVA